MAPGLNSAIATSPSPSQGPFHRAPICLEESKKGPNESHSLPDLIQFNADHNPDHLFAIQAAKRGPEPMLNLDQVTFRALHHAVLACREWLATNYSKEKQNRPVAILMESGLGLFIYLAALLSMEVPVLLLSARLGTAAIHHLLGKTGCRAILVSHQTLTTATQSITETPVEVLSAHRYVDFLTWPKDCITHPRLPSVPRDHDRPGSLILHSSGTTGLPKPIHLTHRYILGYAACHHLSPEDSVGCINVSTLPLYHGFGLLAPCLSLSVGKPCCLPPSSTIPSATLTVDLLRSVKARSLMTVPSIVAEMAALADPIAIETLRTLDFVAVGGGAIQQDVGKSLHGRGVPLLGHYGATEIGALAPIFCPDATYDWRWLRLRSDLGLQLQAAESAGDGWTLVGHPFGWGRSFEVQDLLERRPVNTAGAVEVRIRGRRDDVIVLATGEKVLPQLMEESLTSTEGIKTAVVVGDHRETVGLLIEPQDRLVPSQHSAFLDQVWPSIDELNHRVDRHARIPSPRAVIIMTGDKALPRSDKGSIMRSEVHRLFAEEISQIDAVLSEVPAMNPRNLLESLRVIVQTCAGDRLNHYIPGDQDLFELGMDSLEVSRLARHLNSIPNKTAFPGLPDKVRPDFIYQHPTLSSLVVTITGDRAQSTESDQAGRMLSMIESARRNLGPAGGSVILLTGSTGTLGAHLLATLCRSRKVRQIVCVNRPRPGLQAHAQQENACRAKGVQVPECARDKVTYIQAATHESHLGLSPEQYTTLAASVTHIIHNAWPMDFQRHLSSFRPQVQSVCRLIQLTEDIHQLRPHARPRVVFTSSIAVARHYPNGEVPETRMANPECTVAMGYAEAKWVCEGLLDDAAQSDCFVPAIVRLGQLSGSTGSGFWSKTEHIPTLISASVKIGALPQVKGIYSWLPVDIAAAVVAQITLSSSPCRYYHVENPIRQPWSDLLVMLRAELGLSTVPYEDWIMRATQAGELAHLERFYRHDFLSLAGGEIRLQTVAAREASRALRSCGGVGVDVVKKYLQSWRDQGAIPLK
ncbi:hypothetical protein BDW42DRAFT_189877 [Aspergillus taichungensis]|uniref:NRPS-like enzyme n=1 Tax=Aspergillus taichungensis TaxID=482145 RepID=A0A2J5IA88_9EURO|nr:hypothetical protein BDW42DRAFT_189877 [Aspergillus taichungensis]